MQLIHPKAKDLLNLSNKISSYIAVCETLESTDLLDALHNRLIGLDDSLDKLAMQFMSDSFGMDIEKHIAGFADMMENLIDEIKQKAEEV